MISIDFKLLPVFIPVVLSMLCSPIIPGLFHRESFRVPKIELFRRPQYFGGMLEITLHIAALLIWIGIAGIISAAVSIVILFIDPVTLALDWAKAAIDVSISIPNNWIKLVSTAVFSTLTSLSVYTLIVQRAHESAELTTSTPPHNIQLDQNKLLTEEESKALTKTPFSRVILKKTFLICTFYISIVAAPLSLLYFYLFIKNGDYKRGCALLVLEKYGIDNVIAFSQDYIDHPECSDIQAELMRATTDAKTKTQKSCTYLMGIIGRIGYGPTCHRICNFLFVRALDQERERDARSCNRFGFPKPITVRFECNCKRSKGQLIQASSDSGGIFLAARVPLAHKKDVVILDSSSRVLLRGISVHGNAVVQGNKVHAGSGCIVSSDSVDGFRKYAASRIALLGSSATPTAKRSE